MTAMQRSRLNPKRKKGPQNKKAGNRPSPAARITRLQQTHGNRWVGRLLEGANPRLDRMKAEGEERLQAKLTVSAPGDAYEQEADRVAEKVMRMKDGEELTAAHTDAAAPMLQPMCRDCGESLQREAEDPAVNESVPMSSHDLTRGGMPLPPNVRHFYETRFGREFGAVRVHTGTLAETYCTAIRARAFTYGNHVWLGKQVPLRPSLVLAHELAHVVQQKQPAHIARRQRPPLPLKQSLPEVQRTLYWHAKGLTGDRIHKQVFKRLGEANSELFFEAPVPNADRKGEGWNKSGYADFYQASTTVGVYFTNKHQFQHLKAGSKLRRGKAPYPHQQLAAPYAPDEYRLERISDGPQRIRLGDLKPGSNWSVEANDGVVQLENYKRGFKRAFKWTNKYANKHLQNAGKWDLKDIDVLKDLTIPPFYGTGAGQKNKRLIVKTGSKKVLEPDPPVVGKMFVFNHQDYPGIWGYIFAPTQPVTVDPAEFPRDYKALARERREDLEDPLKDTPIQMARKAMPGLPPKPTPLVAMRLNNDRTRAIRRKKTKDPFQTKYPSWLSAHKRLTSRYQKLRQKKKSRNFLGADLIANALDSVRKTAGIDVPKLDRGVRAKVPDLARTRFWLRLRTRIMGRFRKAFGTLFVKCANAFYRIRDKFRNALKKKRGFKVGKGGLLGAALKAGFAVFKKLGAVVIGQAIAQLSQTLGQRVAKALKAFVGPERLTELEKKLAEIEALQNELEDKAKATIKAMVDQTVGPYLAKLKTIQETFQTLSSIAGIINLVRWGARVIACLSPPGWGCLWIALESVVEKFAATVVETQWFQKKITPLIAKTKMVKEFPRQLAQEVIIPNLLPFLPAALRGVLDKNAKLQPAKTQNIAWNLSADGANALTPERRALLRLQEKLGEDKFKAFAELARRAGIPADKPLTVEDVKNIEALVGQGGLSVQQLRAYAAGFPNAPKGLDSLSQFLAQASSKQGESKKSDEKTLNFGTIPNAEVVRHYMEEIVIVVEGADEVHLHGKPVLVNLIQVNKDWTTGQWHILNRWHNLPVKCVADERHEDILRGVRLYMGHYQLLDSLSERAKPVYPTVVFRGLFSRKKIP